jgi:FKBP-type peptidyl-prolyl cis-trans isomerase
MTPNRKLENLIEPATISKNKTSLKNLMNKGFFLKQMFLFFIAICISICLSAQDDPYYKKFNIPADLESVAREFLQSNYTDIKFNCGTTCSGSFDFPLPSKYCDKVVGTYQETHQNSYTTTETYVTGYGGREGDVPIYGTREVEKYHSPYTTTHNKYGPNDEMAKMKHKLESQKKYTSSVQTVKQYKGFDDRKFQDSVVFAIELKYSQKEYEKYLESKKLELEKLIIEWKNVPLTDSEIQTQTKRIQSSWKNFEKEKTEALQHFNLQCQDFIKAKRFVYLYEHDIQQQNQQEGINIMARINAKRIIEENRHNKNIRETVSGLQYEIIKEGKGKKPTSKDRVKVYFVGTLFDGKKVVSSGDNGKPAEFEFTQFISGLAEGVQLMTEGSIYKLWVPAELGYGNRLINNIPAESILVFEVKLLKVKSKK